jgi:hypothetical protein
MNDMRQIIMGRKQILKNSVQAKELPMDVPDVFISTLHAAGIMPDPFYADNESDLEWIGISNWMMEMSFTTDDALRFHTPQMISLIPNEDHGVEVNGINDSRERIERYLEDRYCKGRFSDNGFHLLNGESKTVVAEKSKLPPDWRKRLRIINLRETY